LPWFGISHAHAVSVSLHFHEAPEKREREVWYNEDKKRPLSLKGPARRLAGDCV
jgi:hypothetical protein